MKTCSICGVVKELSAYYKDHLHVSGTRADCKECHKSKKREFYKNNSCKIKIKTKTYKQANYEKSAEWHREYYLNNKHKWDEGRKKRHRSILARRLHKNYGIDLKKYDSLYESQNGVCAICSKKKTLCVDHRHNPFLVRGLLCRACNLLIGNAKDNILILHNAILYLKRFSDDEAT